jgi:hypothetical protein
MTQSLLNAEDPVLDLSKNHAAHVRGDITVFLTWLKITDQWRPCMAMIRTGEERSEHTIPCIMTLDKAWIWSDVGSELEAMIMAIDFAKCLRLDFTKRSDVWRIMTLVNDYLGDLISMPPRPYHDPVAVAEAVITNTETGKSRDILITESS